MCCDVGGNGEFVGDRISFIPPAAFDSACREIINRFGVDRPQPPARQTRDAAGGSAGPYSGRSDLKDRPAARRNRGRDGSWKKLLGVVSAQKRRLACV